MGDGGLAMRLRKSGYFVGAVSDFLGRVVPEQRRDGQIQRLRCVLWDDVGDLVGGTHG